MSQTANVPGDRGQIFDGVKIGRPATGALVDAGYWSLSDLPEDLAELSDLHGPEGRCFAEGRTRPVADPIRRFGVLWRCPASVRGSVTGCGLTSAGVMSVPPENRNADVDGWIATTYLVIPKS